MHFSKILLAILIVFSCDKKIKVYAQCQDDEFECYEGSQCIPDASYCNEIEDCKDGSDELEYTFEHDYDELCRTWEYKAGACVLPLNQTHKKDVLCNEDAVCPHYKFKCVDRSACLDSDKFCDGKIDCKDGSDELLFNETFHNSEDGVACRHNFFMINVCLLPKKQQHMAINICRNDDKCEEDEFRCLDDSACIRAIDFCDKKPGCLDGSDETAYNESLHTVEDGIMCRNFYDLLDICLLPASRLHLRDDLCRKDDQCDEYKCEDGSKCIGRSDFCNGYVDCRNGEDEIIYNATQHTLKDGLGCLPHAEQNDKYCLLPAKYLCDGTFECPNRADECDCQNSPIFCDGKVDCPLEIDECLCENNTRSDAIKSDGKCFRCLDESRVISSTQVCDNIVQCDDLSDECLCLRRQPSDLASLCQDIYDVSSTKLANCSSLADNNVCAAKEFVCDGRFDEKTGRDEQFCTKLSTTVECTDDERLVEYGVPRCDYTCEYSEKRAMKCDGRISCKKFDDECSEFCDNPPGFCSYVRNLFLFRQTFSCGEWFEENVLYAPDICNGVEDCSGAEDEMFCHRHKFYCENNSTMHIPLEKKCDLITDCDNQSDELFCGNNTYVCESSDNATEACDFTHFYCNDNGTTKYLDKRQKVCDGNEDCASGVDECQNCTVGVFSNDDAMISSKPLIPFLWLISSCAVVGNLLVIVLSTKNLLKFKKSSRMEINQNVLVWNLAIADLLVGIYTTAISIQNIRLSRNRYCLEDQRWRSSAQCSALGILLLIGSEQSVFALCIITAFRMKAVLNPMAKSRVRFICMWMAIAWISSIILATAPTAISARDYFTETIWYSQNTLATTIRREDVPKLTKRLLIMLNDSSVTYDLYGWTLLENLISKLNPTYKPDRRFGFYSSHGVCLPRLFPDPSNDAAWGYSLLFILVNFLAFIYIFVGYLIIYVKATRSNALASSTASSTRAASMQKKVTRIVVTDFLCWMPVCLMALLQLFGIHIPTEVYVPVGTILIPINSALNPFLYSGVPDWISRRLKPARRFFNFRTKSVSEGTIATQELRLSERNTTR
ncbi:uncharacterized protein LOC120327042 isoform X1 [Styela clava]